MPLLNTSRAPNPFSTRQRKSVLPNIIKQDTPIRNDDLIRFYPLDSASNKTVHTNSRAMPVNPLQHSTRQATNPRQLAPTPTQQGFKVQPPMIPTQHKPTPATPPLAEQPPSPEMAAQKFRQANRGLPDGVCYEPLDENTMRLLRENGHLPEEASTKQQDIMPIVPSPPMASLQTNANAAKPQLPTVSQTQHKSIEIIKNLIQDERNAHIFYNHMALESKNQEMSSMLSLIANDCKHHTQIMGELLTVHFITSFTPQEAAINTNLELDSALMLALSEENKALRVLAELHETVNNIEAEKIIQRIINKKMLNYNQLILFRQ